MLKTLKGLLLWLSVALYGGGQVATVALPAVAASTAITAAGPALTPAALAGAVAIVASIAEAPQATTIHGLYWDKSNGTANADMRLLWTGSNLLPRVGHTAIWIYKPFQQTSWYAVSWHSPNTGNWDNGVYSLGMHPLPADDCTAQWQNDGSASEGSSLTTNATGASHCWEIAGGGDPNDYLATPGPGAVGLQVVKNQWYVQIRRCRFTGTVWENTFIPDLIGHPTYKIVHNSTVNPTSTTESLTNAAFYFGTSDWAPGTETPYGVQRGIQLYDTSLSDADAVTEAGNSSSNAAQTGAGQRHLWYINQDPIPSDVTDKKTGGTAHSPTWANANRPSQFDSTFSSGSAPVGLLLRGSGR